MAEKAYTPSPDGSAMPDLDEDDCPPWIGSDGDPYVFDAVFATPAEMIVDPTLNQGLPIADSLLPLHKWSNGFIMIGDDESGAHYLFCRDNAATCFTLVRRSQSPVEIQLLAQLVLTSGIHPNALPERIH